MQALTETKLAEDLEMGDLRWQPQPVCFKHLVAGKREIWVQAFLKKSCRAAKLQQ